MATSLSAQLQAIKSLAQIDPEIIKRPFTRPSVLFESKEAADIDIETIFTVALSGLEVLISSDTRFVAFKETLFSQRSLDLDREKMTSAENSQINASISSFLRLLSGYLNLPSSLKVIEYLIRRYKIHLYNVDDLVLCALPYHDTHAFVRIVQLLGLGKKWAFLEGVKNYGDPLPRKAIVQQCIRDMGTFGVLCDYTISSKSFQPSREVVSFCTAVIIEVLGSTFSLDSDTVKRVLPVVFDGLNTDNRNRRPDQQAASLMIAGLIAAKATLREKVVNSVIVVIARAAQQIANHFRDMQLLRMSLMAIISLVQLQPRGIISKKAFEQIKKISEITGVLTGLHKEFNVNRFLIVYLEALTEYSFSDSELQILLMGALETLPIRNIVCIVVNKVFKICLKLSPSKDKTALLESVNWAQQILSVIRKCYPQESQEALQKFLEDKKMCLNQDMTLDVLHPFIIENKYGRLELSNPRAWLSLEHPEAEVRRSALLSVASAVVKSGITGLESPANLEDVMLRRLHDDDLGVVQAALTVDGLQNILAPSRFVKALQDIVKRCYGEFAVACASSMCSQACDTAVLSLEHVVKVLMEDNHECVEVAAAIVFPMLLVHPKIWKLNVKALELAQKTGWSLYSGFSRALHNMFSSSPKKLKNDLACSINIEIVSAISDCVLKNADVHLAWMMECCNNFAFSRPVFFLILLHIISKNETDGLLCVLHTCFPWLKKESLALEMCEENLVEELEIDCLDKFPEEIIKRLYFWEYGALGSNILICLLWCLVKASLDKSWCLTSVDGGERLHIFEELFVFVASSPVKRILLKEFLRCPMGDIMHVTRFLLNFVIEEGYSEIVQLTSLHCLSSFSSRIRDMPDGKKVRISMLLEFPSVLVALANVKQDIRMAALECIQHLHELLTDTELSNGDDSLGCCSWSPALGDFLNIMIDHKKLIFSNDRFLPELIVSVFSSSSDSLLAPKYAEARFNQGSKDLILNFILTAALRLHICGKFKLLSLFKEVPEALFNMDGVRLLLTQLVDRRMRCHIGHDRSLFRLSRAECELLCLLLEMLAAVSASSQLDASMLACLFNAIEVGETFGEDAVVSMPCINVLKNLSSSFYNELTATIQDQLFCKLVLLLRSNDINIQSAAREALLHLNVNYGTICRIFEMIVVREDKIDSELSERDSKRQKGGAFTIAPMNEEGNMVTLLSSLLDVLLMKNDIAERVQLIGPLFKLFHKTFEGNWLKQDKEGNGSVVYIQQTLCLVIEDIVKSLCSPPNDTLCGNHIEELIKFFLSSKDIDTRNHIILLLTSIAKVFPELVLQHFVSIVTMVGELIVAEINHHSRHAFEMLMSTILPSWLSKAGSILEFLHVFMHVLPEMSMHRRLGIMAYLLRILGVEDGLSYLLVLLFGSLVQRTARLTSDKHDDSIPLFSPVSCAEWEYCLAVQICDQFPCVLWLSSLVLLLRKISEVRSHKQIAEFIVAMQFVQEKLEDTQLSFLLKSENNHDIVQRNFSELLEQLVCKMLLVAAQCKEFHLPVGIKHMLKKYIQETLKALSRRMSPVAYLKAINSLLDHSNKFVRCQALSLLSATARGTSMVDNDKKKRSSWDLASISGKGWMVFDELCLKIADLIVSDEEITVTLAGISAMEVLTSKFSPNASICTTVLGVVVHEISSSNLLISSASLRCTATLTHSLGVKALSALPNIMEHTIKVIKWISPCLDKGPKDCDNSIRDLLFSIFCSLNAVIEKLGGFLNPYLEAILEFLVLHQVLQSGGDMKMRQMVDGVCKLLCEKIPARLILDPLMKMHPEAVICGLPSILQEFEMLACAVYAMDRSSIRFYYASLFEHCLHTLDLRWTNPVSVLEVHIVEDKVIHLMITLIMKLTETMFRPLFIMSLEWAEVDPGQSENNKNLGRLISFYKFVDKLASAQRSLFVPYFKYLLEGSVHHLMGGNGSGLAHKKKKIKVQRLSKEANEESKLSLDLWHLRAMILSCLHKCFLYDKGVLKFLDSSTFQVLLKPIVAQLLVEPPTLLEDPELPSVEEVNGIIVSCLSQMAVTAGTDVLWKSLNHEVLMQTRSEQIRPRLLGLQVVMSLVEHLREEYIVLLAETIPFLSELLEDAEPSVKSQAQKILKELEILSGEDIKAYL